MMDPSVVLVHGAYADGSSWSEVIKRLHEAGISATAVQNPLAALAEDAFLNDFANGVDPVQARVLYAVQGRVSETLFADRTTAAAWRSRPAWYAVSRQDRTTSPELERFLAERMHATTVEIDSGHLSLITHPDEVTALIMDAVRAAQRGRQGSDEPPHGS
jgi:pimeloyl-ACP methyl ester carboxylesterase